MRLLPLLLVSCVFISDDDHAARTGGGVDTDATDGADGGTADGADGAADGADGATDGADGGTDGADGSTDGTDGTDGTDSSTDGADGTTDSPWAGDYTGTIDISFPGRVVGFNSCSGDLSATIDSTGDIIGSWQCGTGGNPSALNGALYGQVSGVEPRGELVFDGDLEDTTAWAGFLIDTGGGTLTGDFEGTAAEATVGNQAYNGNLEATR